MGKNKKRRKSLGSKADAFAVQNNDALNGSATNSDGSESAAVTNARGNPLYTEQQAFLSSLAPNERDFYFSSSVSSGNNSVVAPERRAELWMEQAEIGEVLVNKHAWATPTRECLTIFRHFSPIVEIVGMTWHGMTWNGTMEWNPIQYTHGYLCMYVLYFIYFEVLVSSAAFDSLDKIIITDICSTSQRGATRSIKLVVTAYFHLSLNTHHCNRIGPPNAV